MIPKSASYRQIVRHDIKRYLITSTSMSKRHDVKKYIKVRHPSKIWKICRNMRHQDNILNPENTLSGQYKLIQ